MKKIIAITLSIQILLGSLFPRIDAMELAKIGTLIQHYQEHKSVENQDLSFIDFLIMHYSTTSNHTKTAKHSHHNLPNFGSHNSVLTYCEHVYKANIPSLEVNFNPFSEPNFTWQNFYHFSISRTLLNPPKSSVNG